MNQLYTGKEIHSKIETLVSNFEDADLFFDENRIYRWSEEQHKQEISKGYISIEHQNGDEAFYFDIKSEACV